MGWTGDFDTVFSSSSKTEQKPLETKKSKETIDLLKQMVADGNISQDVAEKYCPDIKFVESEDDKTKKIIKQSLKSYFEGKLSIGTNDVDYAMCLSWLEKQSEHANFRNNIQIGDKVTRNEDGMLVNLSQLNRVAKKNEKQGEHKPTDKVEPKFKVGDWVVSPNGVYWHIDAINNNRYEVSSTDWKRADWPLNTSLYRLWTIQDAKDGDVLAYPDGSIVIFNHKCDDSISELFMAHVLYVDGHIETNNSCVNINVIPATKEQRDTLFKAMVNAGYTFDFVKKELKKIEQKSAKWSEEDEERLTNILLLLGVQVCWDGATGKKKNPYQKEIDWLKSLKDRVQPQPKQEWSKEAENNILFLTSIIEECFKDKEEITLCGDTVCANFTKENVIDRLKSLRPQNTWKPSDDQLYNLSEAAHYRTEFWNCDILIELYDELKKLMEE